MTAAAKGLGNRPPVTNCVEETTYAMPRLARIHWNMREAVGWSELAGAELAAVAGVRWRAGLLLWGTGERAEGLYSLLASPGAR